jgi:hypothetical protein
MSSNPIDDPTGSIKMDVGGTTAMIVMVHLDMIKYPKEIMIRLVTSTWKTEMAISGLISGSPDNFALSINQFCRTRL